MRAKKTISKAVKRELRIFSYTLGGNLNNLQIAKKESFKKLAKAIRMSSAKLIKQEKGLCLQCHIGVLFRLAEYYKINALDIVTKGRFYM